MSDNKISWWKTPLKQPYLNPIENLKHKFKEFTEVKPMRKEELIAEIEDFLDSVSGEKMQEIHQALAEGDAQGN